MSTVLFFNACDNGDLNAINMMSDLSQTNLGKGLNRAAKNNHHHLVSSLLKTLKKDHTQEDIVITLLIKSVENGHNDTTKVVCEHLKTNNMSIPVYHVDHVYRAIFHDICYSKGSSVQLLLQEFPHLFTPEHSHSVLIAGIVYNCPEVSKLMVPLCDVAQKDSKALFLSCVHGFDELSELLYPNSDADQVIKNMTLDECTPFQMMWIKMMRHAQLTKQEIEASMPDVQATRGRKI